MTKKKAAGKQPKATQDLKILKGRVYCITQRRDLSLADQYDNGLRRMGAKAVEAPSVDVTHLVTDDGTLSKTMQKKVDSLSKKGAVIEVLSEEDLVQHLLPPAELILRLVRGNAGDHALLNKHFDDFHYTQPHVLVEGADLRGLEMELNALEKVDFQDVDLRDAKITGATLNSPKRVQFDGASITDCDVHEPDGSSFKGTDMTKVTLTGPCPGTTFEGANLTGASFRMRAAKGDGRPVFKSAILDEINIRRGEWSDLDFSGCSFKKAHWEKLKADGANFEGADLSECTMEHVDLSGASLAGAKLTQCRLTDVDLRGANLDGADFTGALLVTPQFSADFDTSSVKGLAEALLSGPSGGAALQTLIPVIESANKVLIELYLTAEVPGDKAANAEPQECFIHMDCYQNRDFRVFNRVDTPSGKRDLFHTDTFDEAFKRCVVSSDGATVRFEPVTVKTSKSSMAGPKIRELIIEAFAQAFDQTPPEPAELKALTKVYKAEVKAAAEKEKAQEEKAEAEWAKAHAVEQAKAAAAEKAARPQPEEKVTDFTTFVAALEVRADAGRVKNAKKMLKASGFELFHDASKPDQVLGVIKSQSDDKLLYACRLDGEGQFSCCTQNLRPCGGLRGALCKHQLVLLMGLVQAGALDPKKTDAWVEKSLDQDPDLDKEEMGEVFLKYKGAEAGEIDWRPTETLPEDFYAF